MFLLRLEFYFFFFFFNDTAPTEIYTLSLHDALPISSCTAACGRSRERVRPRRSRWSRMIRRSSVPTPTTRSDRKSTRLNSSHLGISYAVFCLKKKKKTEIRSVVSLYKDGTKTE